MRVIRLQTIIILGSLIFIEKLKHVRAIDFYRRVEEWMSDDEVDELSWGARNTVGNFEIVYLPMLLPRSASLSEDASLHDDVPINYAFDAFGKKFDLELRPNRKLLSPAFRVVAGGRPDPALSRAPPCHYLHRAHATVAALSTCRRNTLHGLILAENSTYEIRPLSRRSSSRIQERVAVDDEEERFLGRYPHLIRKDPPLPDAFHDDFLPFRDEPRLHSHFEPRSFAGDFNDGLNVGENERFARDKRSRGDAKYTIEVAVFLDEAAYNIFYPYLNRQEKDMRDMLLAYMNGVQALYHHPSLGTPVDISIVRLELMRRQPVDMPHYGGERSQLLDSFCAYQAKINPADDRDPNHWDMGLYVSGLDFYAMENGRRSGVTMGLATVGGVCIAQYACVIAELGATNAFGKPYPSAGFTSVYILAHEMGHNLGMHHDNSGNSCAKDGYIMSPSRGTSGETVWSPCSAQLMTQLSWAKCLTDRGSSPGPPERDHTRHADAPGQAWGAKRQCELLLRDSDAVPASDAPAALCRQLQCRTPHRAGFYYAGPALTGTDCGKSMWCLGGECVRRSAAAGAVGLGGAGGSGGLVGAAGGWGAWGGGSCSSGCTEGGRGFAQRRRRCDSPPAARPAVSDGACQGSSYDVVLCDDQKICGKKRRVSTSEYASKKCSEFSRLLPELDARAAGLQAPHEEGRLWMGCAIFCRRADTGSYYSPRIDLNDLGVDPYFPDGTRCHRDGAQDYFCLQHHCLPENFKFTKNRWIWELDGSSDVPVPGNAGAYDAPPPASLQRYLSVDARGRPLQRALSPADLPTPNDDDWLDRDYRDLPPEARRRYMDDN